MPICGPARSAVRLTSGQPPWSAATASHILFKGSDASTRAAEVLAEIEAGARSFEDTAADLSACPSGRRAGGSLGSFIPGKMVPAFDSMVFSHSTEVKKLYTVETSHGTHILRVNSRTAISSEGGSYFPERGLQLGEYKSLTTVHDDGAKASHTTDKDAPSPGASTTLSHSDAGTNALTLSTVRQWLAQEQDRKLAVELLAKMAMDGSLTGEENRQLRALLSRLVLTLAS